MGILTGELFRTVSMVIPRAPSSFPTFSPPATAVGHQSLGRCPAPAPAPVTAAGGGRCGKRQRRPRFSGSLGRSADQKISQNHVRENWVISCTVRSSDRLLNSRHSDLNNCLVFPFRMPALEIPFLHMLFGVSNFVGHLIDLASSILITNLLLYNMITSVWLSLSHPLTPSRLIVFLAPERQHRCIERSHSGLRRPLNQVHQTFHNRTIVDPEPPVLRLPCVFCPLETVDLPLAITNFLFAFKGVFHGFSVLKKHPI